MLESLLGTSAGPLSALFQVMMIDLVLAGDNAVAVGLAAAGLPAAQRRKAILLGLAAAVVLRIGFALITVQLLALVGLLLAGGFLLLWVCWRMWRDLHEHGQHDQAEGEQALEDATGVDVDGQATLGSTRVRKAKSFRGAFTQILVADVSMSLDNVLAVAGAAREHPGVMVFGLLLSIALMGAAASLIARLLHRYRWIGFIGLAIVLWVALSMIWEGHRQVVVDTAHTAQYNSLVPDFMDISAAEAAKLGAH
jgi:YjbE family integral membrane protein